MPDGKGSSLKSWAFFIGSAVVTLACIAFSAGAPKLRTSTRVWLMAFAALAIIIGMGTLAPYLPDAIIRK